jgi:hypothetical protein
MLVCDDITRLGLEVVMERSAPTAFGEDLCLGCAELIRRGKVKRDVIAGLPAVMRDEEDLRS